MVHDEVVIILGATVVGLRAESGQTDPRMGGEDGVGRSGRAERLRRWWHSGRAWLHGPCAPLLFSAEPLPPAADALHTTPKPCPKLQPVCCAYRS